jgi:hypothetical protein
MATIPRWLLRQQVTVEPWLGEGPDGPRYGAAEVLACYVENKARVLRAPDGTQTVSTATVYARLGPTVPAQSRVTLPGGRVATVMGPWPADGGGLPTPDHLELLLT